MGPGSAAGMELDFWPRWAVFSLATLGSQHGKQRRSTRRVFKTCGTGQFEKMKPTEAYACKSLWVSLGIFSILL